jgi:hypothetical protein
MALQLGNFHPLDFQHYNLAETFAEKDAAAKRQMAIDNNRANNEAAVKNMEEANANSRAGAQIAENGRQANMSNDIQQQHTDAAIAQQGISNDLAQRQADEATRRNDAAIAQQGVENSLNQQDSARAQNADARAQNADQRAGEVFDQQQADYKQAQEAKQVPEAMAKFGHYLSTAEHDGNGMIDVTDQADNIKTLAGGMDDQQFKNIYAQNINGKTYLMGKNEDGKPTPVLRSGNPISIDNQVLQSAALFGSNKDVKSAKAQAELQQTQLENQKKQLDLANEGQLTPQQKIALSDNLFPVSPNDFNPGKVADQRQSFINYLSQNPKASVTEALNAARGSKQDATQATKSTPAVGDKRMIAGKPATWDGKGWLADG